MACYLSKLLFTALAREAWRGVAWAASRVEVEQGLATPTHHQLPPVTGC